jgi:hypothetical protein
VSHYKKRGPKEWPDEHLICDLEECLEHLREEDDPFLLAAPILDALDRHMGAADFDADKNWETLCLSQPKKKRTHPRVLLLASIIIFCLAACGVAMGLHLHGKFASFFQVGPEETALVLPLTEEPEASDRQNGVTVRVLQTISDTVGSYVLYEITTPKTVTLPENILSVNSILIPEYPKAFEDRLGGNGGTKLLEAGAHRLLALSYTIENSARPLEHSMRLCFLPNLSLRYREEGSFQTKEYRLLDAPVMLEWEGQVSDSVKKWTPDRGNAGKGYTVREVVLSPISFSACLDGTAALPDTATLFFVNGTKREIALDQADAGHVLLEEGSGLVRHRIYCRFSSPIDHTTVEKVSIGTVEISIN